MFRRAAPYVLGALVRRSRDFEVSEDAVWEAMLAAYANWPAHGIPQDPTAWLITVAHRRLIDQLRSDLARVRRETQEAELSLRELEAADPGVSTGKDDTLTLLFLCCHPALTPISQVALTLRAVGGLTTAQIARAFLVSEASMTQRITRAKHKIRQSDQPFRMRPAREGRYRLQAVQHVLYLVFNEGYLASSGPQLQQGEYRDRRHPTRSPPGRAGARRRRDDRAPCTNASRGEAVGGCERQGGVRSWSHTPHGFVRLPGRR